MEAKIYQEKREKNESRVENGTIAFQAFFRSGSNVPASRPLFGDAMSIIGCSGWMGGEAWRHVTEFPGKRRRGMRVSAGCQTHKEIGLVCKREGRHFLTRFMFFYPTSERQHTLQWIVSFKKGNAGNFRSRGIYFENCISSPVG